MKNHFFFPYTGNKRQEVERIMKYIEVKGINTIIEPFCGSSAMSFYISTLYPNKFKYILNDVDTNLIQLYRIAKEPTELKELEERINILIEGIDKAKYKEILKLKTLESWIISHKIYQIRPSLFPVKYVPKKITLEDYLIVSFLRNEDVEITNEDAIECYNKYSDNKQNLIFIDPPYINSCNEIYTTARNMNIYEYLYNSSIKDKSSKIVLCLENIWIIQLLFSKAYSITYDKTYEMSKKKTTHILISNKKMLSPPLN